MKNIVKAILSILTAAFLIILSIIASAATIAVAPIYFLCVLVFYCAELCAELANAVVAWTKDSIGVAHSKEVVFRIEPDSPDGIKLSDIANGKSVEYNGVDLRGVLQYARSITDEHDSSSCYATPVLLVSSSGQRFLCHERTVYPVQPPIKRPAHLFPPRKKTSSLYYTCMQDRDAPVNDKGAVREIVLKTGLVVTGPRTNDVRLQFTENERSDLARVRLIVPSIAVRKTPGMTPIHLALLSPCVVSDNSESVFFRRYVALARACMGDDGELPLGLKLDIHMNMQQFVHVLTYNKGTISRMNAEFLINSVRLVDKEYKAVSPKYDMTERVQHLRRVLLLLGLSQSEETMFRPFSAQSKLWVVSEFIHSKQFQNAVISAAMASMTSSIDRGITSKEAILKGMPYLCKQIPGLCEAVYTIVRAAKYNNSACDEGELSNLALYNIANVLRTQQDSSDALDLPSVDESNAFEGMSERAVERFDALKDNAFRASHSSYDVSNVDEIYKIGRSVLRNKHCSEIIAYLVAHNIRSNGMRAGGVFHLHSHDMSDNLIVEYVKTDLAFLGHAFATLGAKLAFADRQECEMSLRVRQADVHTFPELKYPTSASETSLDSSKVTAVGAESGAAGRPATRAANA